MPSHAQPQIIRAEAPGEFVVLRREEYDALLAAAGDEEAEERASARIMAETRAAVARGEDAYLPDWFAIAVARGGRPAKVVRDRQGRTAREVAAAAGIPESVLSDIEGGAERPTGDVRARLATALGVDERWLDV